jgi:hypothetical protein
MGGAGGRAGVAWTADFAVGLAFLGDACRTGAFGGPFSDRPGLSVRGRLGDWKFLALYVGFAFGFISCRHLQPPSRDAVALGLSISLVKDFDDLDPIHVQTKRLGHLLTTHPIQLIRVQCL